MSKTTKLFILRTSILITYFLYLYTSIKFVNSHETIQGKLLLFFTLYPFIFVIYIYRLKDRIKELNVHKIIKYMLLMSLGIVGVTIIGGLTEAIRRYDEQSLRSMVSIVISFLMFIIIIFDFYIIKEIKKIATQNKRGKPPLKRKSNKKSYTT